MLRRCAYGECGRVFETANVRRLFCCERCRRAGQNAARRSARAEAREARENVRPMEDPWARLPADEWEAEEVWANALLDALPVGLAANTAASAAERPAPLCRNSGSSGMVRGGAGSASASARQSGAGEPVAVPRGKRETRRDQLFPSA